MFDQNFRAACAGNAPAAVVGGCRDSRREAVQYRNLNDPSQHGLVEVINRNGSKNRSTLVKRCLSYELSKIITIHQSKAI
jgi:hypothetical protein